MAEISVKLPEPRSDDSEDVVWGLSTATALWARGERRDAVVWIRRAAEAAEAAGNPFRASELGMYLPDLEKAIDARVAMPLEEPAPVSDSAPISSFEVVLDGDTPPPAVVIPPLVIPPLGPVAPAPAPVAAAQPAATTTPPTMPPAATASPAPVAAEVAPTPPTMPPAAAAAPTPPAPTPPTMPPAVAAAPTPPTMPPAVAAPAPAPAATPAPVVHVATNPSPLSGRQTPIPAIPTATTNQAKPAPSAAANLRPQATVPRRTASQVGFPAVVLPPRPASEAPVAQPPPPVEEPPSVDEGRSALPPPAPLPSAVAPVASAAAPAPAAQASSTAAPAQKRKQVLRTPILDPWSEASAQEVSPREKRNRQGVGPSATGAAHPRGRMLLDEEDEDVITSAAPLEETLGKKHQGGHMVGGTGLAATPPAPAVAPRAGTPVAPPPLPPRAPGAPAPPVPSVGRPPPLPPAVATPTPAPPVVAQVSESTKAPSQPPSADASTPTTVVAAPTSAKTPTPAPPAPPVAAPMSAKTPTPAPPAPPVAAPTSAKTPTPAPPAPPVAASPTSARAPTQPPPPQVGPTSIKPPPPVLPPDDDWEGTEVPRVLSPGKTPPPAPEPAGPPVPSSPAKPSTDASEQTPPSDVVPTAPRPIPRKSPTIPPAPKLPTGALGKPSPFAAPRPNAPADDTEEEAALRKFTDTLPSGITLAALKQAEAEAAAARPKPAVPQTPAGMKPLFEVTKKPGSAMFPAPAVPRIPTPAPRPATIAPKAPVPSSTAPKPPPPPSIGSPPAPSARTKSSLPPPPVVRESIAPPADPIRISNVELRGVEPFSQLPEEVQRLLVRTAIIEDLAPGEGRSSFGAVLVVAGEVSICAVNLDVPVKLASARSFVASRGSLAEPVPMRVLGGSSGATISRWSAEAFDQALRAHPQAEQDCRAASDALQARIGLTLGALAEVDLATRDQMLEQLEVRAVGPEEWITEEDGPMPGLVFVVGGNVEILEGEPAVVVADVRPGDLLFPEALWAGAAAPLMSRAAASGALLLVGDRKLALDFAERVPVVGELLSR